LAARRREREMVELLGLTSLAVNGDSKAVNGQIEKWSDQ